MPKGATSMQCTNIRGIKWSSLKGPIANENRALPTSCAPILLLCLCLQGFNMNLSHWAIRRLSVFTLSGAGIKYEPQVRTITLTPFLNELLQDSQTVRRISESDEEVSRLLSVLRSDHERQRSDYNCCYPKTDVWSLSLKRWQRHQRWTFSLKEWERKLAHQTNLVALILKSSTLHFSYGDNKSAWFTRCLCWMKSSQSQSIADQVGYQNDSSYIKAFKASFDVTPQQLRFNGRRR